LKAEVTLALRQGPETLVPILAVNVELVHLQGFLDALLELSKFIPVVALLDGSIVSGYELTPLGLAIKGHKLERLQ
jgi:hypothetical protein